MYASETGGPAGAVDSKPSERMTLRAWRKRTFKGVEAVLFVLVISVLALVFLQVIARYVLHISLPWTEEAARVALLWTVMLGAAVAMERREHYAITVATDLLPASWGRIVGLSANVVGLVFLVAFSVFGLRYAEMGMHASYIALGIPRGWIYFALPVGGLLMAGSLVMQSLEILLRTEPAGRQGLDSGQAVDHAANKVF